MKVVISPAKSLDFESELPTPLQTEACFLDEAERLNKVLRKKSPKALKQLMGISDNLAELNYGRNQQWTRPFTPENARPAVYAFNGDVYQGLDVYTLPKEKIDRMQEKLRILSGLYGLLKPLDLMQPYRLEMGTKLGQGSSKDLYQFWQKKITKKLNEELTDDEVLVNLASNEYFKAIDTKSLKVPVINIDFKDFKNGKYKIISFFAKKARGYMTRFIIENDCQTVDDLKAFNHDGYAFSEGLSKENQLVFTR
jgi:cytoplasmic iron level regulating protein YaaA (DUF328/UPF0246 family)